MYSLDEAILIRTHKIHFMLKNIEKTPVMLPELALRLTLISSNYPCLEGIFMVPKVFEPLKFYFIWFSVVVILLNVGSGVAFSNLYTLYVHAKL